MNLGTATRGLQDIASTVLRIGDPELPVFQRITLNVNDSGDPVAIWKQLQEALQPTPWPWPDEEPGLGTGPPRRRAKSPVA